MNFDEYQTAAYETRNRDINHEQTLAMTGLGLCGEAGKCSELLKKHLFHGHKLDEEKLIKELGDVLWYLSSIASEIGVSLHEVAQKNIAKLKSRYPNGFSHENSINRSE